MKIPAVALALASLCPALPLRAADVTVQSISYQLMAGDKLPVFYAHLLGEDFNAKWQKYKSANPAQAQQLFQDPNSPTEQANDFATIVLQNKGGSDAEGIRVEVGVQGYAEPGVQTLTVKAGATATVRLTPAFKDAIYAISETKPVNIYTKVANAQGQVLFEKTRKITLLGKDYMIWSAVSVMGQELSYGIATFVTPHDSTKAIDRLLSAAAEKMPGRALGGYQLGDGESHQHAVELQAKAIYDTIHEMGIRYVNAPVSYGLNDQRVKFPSESIADKSGNCIEGAVLFASAFESLGMRPLIILVPGHAFVGVRLWDDSDTVGDKDVILPIETTMVGTDGYTDAVAAGIQELNDFLSRGEVTFVDVAILRQLGVTPAPM